MRSMSWDVKTKAGRGYRGIRVWVAVVAAGLMTVAGSLKAQTQLAGPPGPESPQVPLASPATFGTHYKTYHGADFQPWGNDTYTTTIFAPLGKYSLGTGSDFDYETRLDLPQGAILTEIEFYYIDNSTTGGIRFISHELNPSTGGFSFIAFDVSSGASPAVQTFVSTVTPTVIDNTQRQYELFVVFEDPGTSQQLMGARVGYTGPAGNLFLLPSSDRFVDTRPATTIGGKVGPFVGISGGFDFFDFTVTGVPGRDGNIIPTGSTGVVGNVTAIGPTANGLFKILPGGTPCTTGTSTVNFNAKFNTANAFNAGLNASGELRACFGSTTGATSDLTIDVVGATQ